MKYQVELDGRPIEFELVREGGEWRFRAGGTDGVASVLEVEPGIYSVLMEGRSFEARVEGPAVTVAGRRFVVEVRDPRQLSRNSHAFHGEGRQNVIAPMPGKVVRVLVKQGDAVEAGQGLLVVEAMKMQNELKSPKTGRVASLPAREGATVGAGEVLAAIE